MTGTVFVALLAGHLLGDWVVQTDHQAANKATSWKAMLGHVTTYHAVLTAFVLPVWWSPWALAGIAVSYVTHAFIDRRWPVRRLLKATGSDWFSQQMWGVLAADQALHLSILAAIALAAPLSV